MSEYREPPQGWDAFGTHIYRAVQLEFSDELDEAGMPLWERPVSPDPVMGEGTAAATSDPSRPVAGGPCALCGKDPAAGYASMWSPNTGEKWYCHGDDDEDPTCYMRAPIIMDPMVDLDRGRPSRWSPNVPPKHNVGPVE